MASRRRKPKGELSRVLEAMQASSQETALAERLSRRSWAEANIITENGHRLTLVERPYLAAIYEDQHPEMCIQKSAQMGCTLFGIVHSLHRVSVAGDVGIVTFPTDAGIHDLVLARVDPIIDNSPYLRALAGRGPRRQGGQRGVDNTGLKRLGAGALYFRGAETERNAVSVPANFLVHDELDRSSPEVIDMYLHRLDAQPPGEQRLLTISTPTDAGFGISARYEASDRREWFVRCQSCGWCGPLDYFVHTLGELDYLRCTKCGGVLDPRRGEWVAAHPDRDVHGYHITRLLAVLPGQADALRSLHRRRAQARSERTFMNMDLGLAVQDGTSRILPQEILASRFTEAYAPALAAESGTGPFVMGVDQVR